MDRQDDESLSMRIAGLHMLDLTLEHLGIQTHVATGDPEADDVQRTVRDGLEEIIALCGKGAYKCLRIMNDPADLLQSRVSKATIL